MNEHYKTIQHWGDNFEVYQTALKTAKKGDLFVEVGVWLGHSICWLGEHAKDIKIHAVDLFFGENMHKEIVENGFKDASDVRGQFESNLELQGIKERVQIHQGDSYLLASDFTDESIKCVYIDGDHSYTGLLLDIAAYYPKVKHKGIIGGHDWENTDANVKRAVSDFASRYNLEVHVTTEAWPSWYIIKP